jgi:hypothetical protein
MPRQAGTASYTPLMPHTRPHASRARRSPDHQSVPGLDLIWTSKKRNQARAVFRQTPCADIITWAPTCVLQAGASSYLMSLSCVSRTEFSLRTVHSAWLRNQNCPLSCHWSGTKIPMLALSPPSSVPCTFWSRSLGERAQEECKQHTILWRKFPTESKTSGT